MPRPSSVQNALRVLVLYLGIELLGFAFSGEYSAGRLLGVVAGTLLLFWLMRQVHAQLNWAPYALTGFIGLNIVVSVVSFKPEYRQHPGETVIGVLSILLFAVVSKLTYSFARKNHVQFFLSPFFRVGNHFSARSNGRRLK